MVGQVSIRFFRPGPPLRDAISTYYVLRIGGEAPLEDLLHPEWANIRLLLCGPWRLTFPGGASVKTDAPAALVSGTLSRSTAACGWPGHMVGVGLLPAGWALLTGLSAADYVDSLRPLSALVGAAADGLLAALLPLTADEAFCAALDAWFLAQLTAKPAVDPLLVEAHRVLMDPELATVAEWAQRLGRSTRQLERIALDYFGLSPKHLLRRQRFLRTFAIIREQPPGVWGRLIDQRYADQPQFVRDFNDFMGMSPRAYFGRSFPFMAAAGDARKALLGAPLQGLHAFEGRPPAPAVAPRPRRR
jgi:AraC-like DNA-binding protein